MKKQPLDYFRNDPWPIRLAVLLIVRLTWPSLIVAAAPILMKVLPWPTT
jgi:predicted anti-sigma-YlaC factor YlaD